MRKRYHWDPVQNKLVEISGDRSISAGPMVVPDLPGYVSPVTGEWVEGRRARRNDLKKSGCRPYEGREQEMKEAARQREYMEKKLDALAEKMAHRAWAEAPERIRKVFRSR